MVAAQAYCFISAHPRYATRLGLVDNRGATILSGFSCHIQFTLQSRDAISQKQSM